MGRDNKDAVQVTKEIMVKFVETGAVSPLNFARTFNDVYKAVFNTLNAFQESERKDETAQENAAHIEYRK